MADPTFWDDQNGAQTIINELNEIRDMVNTYTKLSDTYDNLELTYELVKEEYDEDVKNDLETEVQDLVAEMNTFELRLLLSGPYDKSNAILELHPGAGGTESQD